MPLVDLNEYCTLLLFHAGVAAPALPSLQPAAQPPALLMPQLSLPLGLKRLLGQSSAQHHHHHQPVAVHSAEVHTE
jgi:hypothetical protein